MIEFKADCGHTVRAKDQDAGKAVRCSYCGNTVNVPEEQADDLDFFFNEVDRAADGSGGANASSPGATSRKGPRKRKPKRDFDPFALALKMCYGTLVVIAVWVIATQAPKWWAKVQSGQTVDRSPDDGRPTVRKKTRRGRPAASSRHGLASLTGDWGLYVSSVPAGARVYVALKSDVKKNQPVSDVEGCRKGVANMMLAQGKLPAGTYTVEVRHLWNDPQLKTFPEYRAFRRRMEDAGGGGARGSDADKAEKARRKLMAAYFLPDEASNVLIDQGHDSEYYLVRQYTDVEVREGQWAEVRALFLPRTGGVANGDGSFSLERVRAHVPQGANYTFDESFVKDELEYYGVAPTDVQFALDVLKWQGLVPYQTPDRGLRMFKIRIADGAFIAADIKDLLLP